MTQAIAGTSPGATNSSAPAPGSLFGWPKYGTQPRFVPDQANAAIGVAAGGVPLAASQTSLQTTRLDQLDIVMGEKLYVQYTGRWTNTGTALANSPFFPASIFQQITIQLQAAYKTFNLTGPLAAIHQTFRPMWGNRQIGMLNPDKFCQLGLAAAGPTYGSTLTANYAIDIPFSMHFDEYFDLDIEGNPTRQLFDVHVSPTFMAAQARSVTPTITLAPQLTTNDLLGGPVSRPSSDTTSTYTLAAFAAQMQRNAYWTASSDVANPPQFPWLTTNDFFTMPTGGQNSVQCLIQNTGVSVGQVLALYGFIWDPGITTTFSTGGGVVPFSAVSSYQLVQGGSLISIQETPQMLQDRLALNYGIYAGTKTASWPSGIFIFDFALSEDGCVITNKNAINTYLVNGVSLNINFNSGSAPGANATVYMGVEALKFATS